MSITRRQFVAEAACAAGAFSRKFDFVRCMVCRADKQRKQKMKKLMIALAVVAMGIAANAASYTWSTTGRLYDGSGSC